MPVIDHVSLCSVTMDMFKKLKVNTRNLNKDVLSPHYKVVRCLHSMFVFALHSFLFSIVANLQGKMGNQAGSLKKHIETAEKTGLDCYHSEL